MSEISFKAREFNVLGEKSVFEGNLQSNFETYLYGEFKGELIVNGKNVMIERHAHLNGIVRGENVHIWGRVEGKIEAIGKVIIYPTAVVSGERKASSLVVYPGSTLSSSNSIEAIESLQIEVQ